MISLTISHPADAGQRLDRFVRKYLPGAPLGGIFKMIRTGKIKINGKKKDQIYKLELGDEVTFWLTDEEMGKFKIENEKGKIETGVEISQKQEAQGRKIFSKGAYESVSDGEINFSNEEIRSFSEISILYEDEYLMVINKPAGINVHAGDHKTTESNIIDQVQDYLQGKYNSLTFRPALVHRIDRDTSGCLLIAKDKGVLEVLLTELQSHDMEKVYHLIVVGIPTKQQDTIRARLLRIPDAKNEAKVRVDETGQSAITHYTLLQTFMAHQSFSLLECRIETGRTHQIRVHMAYIGHPVLADRAYGDKSINSYIRRDLGINRQLLHAYSLTFMHPKTRKKLTITAPYPPDFHILIDSGKKDLQQIQSTHILHT